MNLSASEIKQFTSDYIKCHCLEIKIPSGFLDGFDYDYDLTDADLYNLIWNKLEEQHKKPFICRSLL